MAKKKKSSIKGWKRSEKARLRNQMVKSTIKTIFKKAVEAITEKRSKEEVDPLIKKAIRIVDKAVSKGIIHKNTAARKKSRLMEKYNLAYS